LASRHTTSPGHRTSVVVQLSLNPKYSAWIPLFTAVQWEQSRLNLPSAINGRSHLRHWRLTGLGFGMFGLW
jgi:hypothetical protein